MGNPYFYASLTISEPHYNKMRANNSLTRIINYFPRHTLFFCLLPRINVRLGHMTQSDEFHVGRRNTLTTGQFTITSIHQSVRHCTGCHSMLTVGPPNCRCEQPAGITKMCHQYLKTLKDLFNYKKSKLRKRDIETENHEKE